MRVFAGKTLYAAQRAGAYIGVFSSIENARKVDSDEVEEVKPFSFSADTSSAKYACMAEGTWGSSVMAGGSCITEVHPIAPVWGYSIQSAVLGLYRYQESRKGVVLKKLYIFEIDKVYSEQPVDAAGRFGFIAKEFEENAALSEETLAQDWIEKYLEEVREREEYEEYEERYRSRHTFLIMERIKSSGGVRIEDWRTIRDLLSRNLTLRELQIAAVLWGLENDEEISDQIAKGIISEETKKELMIKVNNCIIRTPSCRRRKRLKDYLD